MVFIICASASTARRSFSTLDSANSGRNAMSTSASSTSGSMGGWSGAAAGAAAGKGADPSSSAPSRVGACTWNTVWWKSV